MRMKRKIKKQFELKKSNESAIIEFLRNLAIID